GSRPRARRRAARARAPCRRFGWRRGASRDQLAEIRARLGDRGALRADQRGHGAEAELEQLVEARARDGRALGGALHLDDAARLGGDHVEVDLRLAVLDVGEVEQALVLDEADADGRDRLADDAGADLAALAQPVE